MSRPRAAHCCTRAYLFLAARTHLLPLGHSALRLVEMIAGAVGIGISLAFIGRHHVLGLPPRRAHTSRRDGDGSALVRGSFPEARPMPEGNRHQRRRQPAEQPTGSGHGILSAPGTSRAFKDAPLPRLRDLPWPRRSGRHGRAGLARCCRHGPEIEIKATQNAAGHKD